jgi:arabinofuranosyltransferase
LQNRFFYIKPLFQKGAFLLIYVLFIIWSLSFIYRSSFLIQKTRYYSLFDDGMISLRYAWNFSHHKGLVFNSGEYLEGYTNPLQVFLMSGITYIFNKRLSVLMVQLLSVIELLVLNFLLLKFWKKKEGDDFFFLFLLSVGVFLYYPLNFWTLLGMETGLLAIGILSLVYFSYECLDKCLFSDLIGLSLSSFFLVWVRNETVIYIVFSLFILWRYMDKKERHKLKYPFSFLILAILLQISFRYFYYGDIFPLTYYLKLSGKPLFLRIHNGLIYQKYFFAETFIWWGFLLFFGIKGWLKKYNLIIGLITINILYQVYIGGDAFFWHRFFVPFYPLVLFLLLKGFKEMTLFLKNSSFIFLIGMFFIILIFSGEFPHLKRLALILPPYTTYSNKLNVKTALCLKDILPQHASLGLFWLGAIGYYTDFKCIDFLGKCDSQIAKLHHFDTTFHLLKGQHGRPGHDKYDLNYSIKKLQPDYIQNYFWGQQNLKSYVFKHYHLVNFHGLKLWLKKMTKYKTTHSKLK